MTSHLHVQFIVDYLHKRNIHHVVVCPGSRSAPFIVALNDYAAIKKYVIVDERSAAYFALGMAQQLRKPVVVICTSGTAVLNLAPALCEAYYQNLPLIAITADRPEELLNTGENQTINQQNVFENFIGMSIHFRPMKSANDFNQFLPLMDSCISSQNGQSGFPSHWNVEIAEPLYDVAGEELPFYELEELNNNTLFDLDDDYNVIMNEWPKSRKIMLICGFAEFSPKELLLLKDLTKQQNIVLISEHASNIPFHQKAPWNTDAMIALMASDEERNYTPDLVVTFGRNILSKKLKQFLRKNKPKHHVHLSPHYDSWNQFLMHKNHHNCHKSYENFFSQLPFSFQADANFKIRWGNLRLKAEQLTQQFIELAAFSDLKVYETIFAHLPVSTNLQLGNSTPVRYAQFFPLPKNTKVNANRGTSGIDGCLSTAAGAAWVNKRLTVAILGDISFFYDSNALWNNCLSPNLRVIVINNGGGNIFRLIDGPDTVKGFENYFETQHQLSAKHLAEMFGLHYYICKTQKQLEDALPDFFQPKKKAAILEVKTNNETSAAVYKQYFSFLKQQNTKA